VSSGKAAAFAESCYRLDGSTDPNLADYFTVTGVLGAVGRFDDPKALVVGITGIGKSAAFRYLADLDETPEITVALNPDRYTLHLPRADLNYRTCQKLFEGDLVIECLRAVTEHHGKLVGKVRARDLAGARATVDEYVKKVKSAAGRVSGISVLGCGLTVSPGKDKVPVGLTQDDGGAKAVRLLKTICGQGVRIRIVVDDPEQVFSASQQLDPHLVGGFCMAALRLSADIPRLKVIVLLKTFVYYPLLRVVTDFGKYPDSTGSLSWSEEELADVIERRADWAGVRLQDVFNGAPRALVADMASEVRDGPRDLLRWVYYALQQAGEGKAGRAEVDAARDSMAAGCLTELTSSFQAEYEDLEVVLRILVAELGGKRVPLSELREHIRSVRLENDELKELGRRLQWLQRATASTLPVVLLRAGALVLESDGRQTFPYQAGYTEKALEQADKVGLVPAVAAGLA
jgi:hypothetical protein